MTWLTQATQPGLGLVSDPEDRLAGLALSSSIGQSCPTRPAGSQAPSRLVPGCPQGHLSGGWLGGLGRERPADRDTFRQGLCYIWCLMVTREQQAPTLWPLRS